ncbi:MAG: PD-(D/E)XK nuclease superfamily protein [Dehalococcoidia bacterium]
MTPVRRPSASAQGGLFEPTSWQGLTAACAEIARALGLDVETEVYVGRRIWGARRRIDIVITDRAQRRSLGIEAKYQKSAGSAEEKIPSTIEDIRAWPIPGIVCFYGPGFSSHMRSFLLSSGKAVELSDLETWLRLYFVLPVPRAAFVPDPRPDDAEADDEPDEDA